MDPNKIPTELQRNPTGTPTAPTNPNWPKRTQMNPNRQKGLKLINQTPTDHNGLQWTPTVPNRPQWTPIDPNGPPKTQLIRTDQGNFFLSKYSILKGIFFDFFYWSFIFPGACLQSIQICFRFCRYQNIIIIEQTKALVEGRCPLQGPPQGLSCLYLWYRLVPMVSTCNYGKYLYSSYRLILIE